MKEFNLGVLEEASMLIKELYNLQVSAEEIPSKLDEEKLERLGGLKEVEKRFNRVNARPPNWNSRSRSRTVSSSYPISEPEENVFQRDALRILDYLKLKDFNTLIDVS